MPIPYALFENNITAAPKDYAATVQISGSADGDAEGDRRGSPKIQNIVDQGHHGEQAEHPGGGRGPVLTV